MKLIQSSAILVIGLALAACGERPANNSATADAGAASSEFTIIDGVKTKNIEGFDGVVAKNYADSEEWWAPYETPNEDAPNVIIFLLDDVGFAQVGSFGGLIETPNIDQLAANGLRFNNFHTTALCSPSRAALLTGRYPARLKITAFIPGPTLSGKFLPAKMRMQLLWELLNDAEAHQLMKDLQAFGAFEAPFRMRCA